MAETQGSQATKGQILQGRDVPLGGVRAITVRRTLPHRDRSFVGAWCFVDHYGPHRIDADGTGGMDVPPHPHTGLQTVSWLFEGEIEHRDSGGVIGRVLPGEINLMTAGHGICHSEVSTPETTVLHGVQLWVALPEVDRDVVRGFQHHAPEAVSIEGGAGSARVFLGSLEGIDASPVVTHTPLLGAELVLEPGAVLELPVDREFEHAVLVDRGEVNFSGMALSPADLGCLDAGESSLRLEVGDEGARIVLLGGPPFEEEIVMWWNFVGRSHDEIVAFRDEWEASAEQVEAGRFGSVPGYVGTTTRIPAPPLPGVQLRPRRREGRVGG